MPPFTLHMPPFVALEHDDTSDMFAMLTKVGSCFGRDPTMVTISSLISHHLKLTAPDYGTIHA